MLARVGHRDAVVAGIADAVEVAVGLPRIGSERAVVDPEAAGVGDEAIAVTVEVGAGVAGVAEAIEVSVELIRVRIAMQLSQMSPTPSKSPSPFGPAVKGHRSTGQKFGKPGFPKPSPSVSVHGSRVADGVAVGIRLVGIEDPGQLSQPPKPSLSGGSARVDRAAVDDRLEALHVVARSETERDGREGDRRRRAAEHVEHVGLDRRG